MGEARIKWIDRLYACEDAFEGSDIPTSRITPGLVGELITLLEIANNYQPHPKHFAKDSPGGRTRTLLARLKPETDDV